MEEERGSIAVDPQVSASPAAVSELRAGIVGTGFIGRVHARSARLAGARLAGVAASSPESAREAAGEIGAERAFASAEELVVSDEIDVVHVCAPNHLHLPLARAALEAGKHVVCEKPVALDAAGAAELVAAAELAGRVATVPFVYRYYPTVREARARARDGALGELRLLHGGYLQDWLLAPSDDNWRVEPALGGPSRAFADIGSHWCDLIEFVSGQRIASLSARTAVAHAERPRREARSFERGDGDGAPRAVETEDIATVMFETDVGNRRLDRDLAGVGGAQEPALVRGLGAPRPRSGFDQEQPETLVGRPALGHRADAARLRHPERRGGRLRHPSRRPSAGICGLLRRLRPRDLRRDRGRAGRRRAADARRRAAGRADHRGRARVGARVANGWR